MHTSTDNERPEDPDNHEGSFRFTVAPGVLSLISAAAGGRRDEGFSFLLNGDLAGMAAQKRFLEGRGFTLGQTDCYPALRSEDVKRALSLIFAERVEGWWNYENQFAEHGICGKDEFSAALKSYTPPS